MDSKKELEKLLKVTCEVFIMSVTKATVEPMLSFITKVTAVRARSKYTSQNAGQPAQASNSKPLREQVELDSLSVLKHLGISSRQGSRYSMSSEKHAKTYLDASKRLLASQAVALTQTAIFLCRLSQLLKGL